LQRNLIALAQKYKEKGLDLFVFGSFARGDQRPTSDLDLGITWRGKRNPNLFRRLYQEIQALPTIRPIELVDFAQTDPKFRETAGLDRIYLADIEASAYEKERIAHS
jgi:predicted nucleotidyltransferase